LLLLSNEYLLWAVAGFPDKITFWSVIRALLVLLLTGILLNALCLLIISF
jgi:cytochrome b subunit of formate dehydrogenase